MEPGTDGAPLILKSELSPPMNSEDGGTVSVYRCIANLKGKVCRNADPRANTPIRRSGQVGWHGVSVYRCGQGEWQGMSVYQCIADVRGKVRRHAHPRGKYADPGREGISVYRCIGVSVRSCLRAWPLWPLAPAPLLPGAAQ